MTIVNFSHPLTAEQLRDVARLTGSEVARVIDIPCQFDPQQGFAAQAREMVDSVGLGAAEWQSLPLLICLPSLNVIAAAVLAELHGRTGYFPCVLRLRQVEGSLPPRFEVAEILDLQGSRDSARRLREQSCGSGASDRACPGVSP